MDSGKIILEQLKKKHAAKVLNDKHVGNRYLAGRSRMDFDGMVPR